MDNVQQARRLHESLATAVRTSRQCMREVALGLAEMRARKLYKELGYASLAEYGEQALNFRDGKTGQLATLGDRLKGLPHLDAAMKHGAIGWTTARSIARVATPETEEEWIKRAMSVSSRELEDLICDARSGDLPPEADDDMGPYRYVWTDIRLDVLDADLLMRAFATMRQEWGDISASQMLMLMAERQLYETKKAREEPVEPAADEAPNLGENAYAIHHRVIEHRCPDCDKAWVETEAGEYELEEHEREHIEDDAEVVNAVEGSKDHGHVTRTIPPAIRKSVLIRDKGRCQVPGCRCNRHLELHHIKYRSEGGTHAPENLVCLCSAHHSMVHRDVIQLKRNEDGAIEVDRGGQTDLGLVLSIWRERAPIEHYYLDEFDGDPGKWCCIEGYFGKDVAKEARERKDEHVFVPPPQEDEHAFVRPRAPRLKFKRGKMVFRYGDDERPAPFWMEKPIRV